jgi:transcriptional regulator with XRE-family HTH domain/tetratricopeptide (TPR) repeat protein
MSQPDARRRCKESVTAIYDAYRLEPFRLTRGKAILMRTPSSFSIPSDLWGREPMVDALRARDLGAVFKLLKKYTGASQTRIGMRCGMAQPEVSDIMNGKRSVTHAEVFERVADGLELPDEARIALGVAPRNRSLAEPANMVGTVIGLEFESTPMRGVESAVELWEADIGRRHVLDGAFVAAAFSTPVLRWLIQSPTSTIVAADGARRVGLTDVAAIEEMGRTFQKLDNRYGGGRVRETVITYLHSEVAPLLKHGQYSEATSHKLFSATAEMTRLAGWMAYDTGRAGLGQRYLIQALRLALNAGNKELGTEILAGMSHQAAHFGQPIASVDLAHAAAHSAQDGGSASLRAEAAVMAAHGYALQGDERSCAKALQQAEAAFADVDPANEPAWLSYFDAAYLSAKFAHCFYALGHSAEAERFALRSLEMNDDYVRGRMFNTALLASIQAQGGNLDQAIETGAIALSLAEELQSERTHRYLVDLRSELERHPAHPATTDFVVRLNSLVGDDRT